ncbi:hypothetical protein [Tolypothrix sp. VBCCA 56010]|uniref:hypothetical protein n=1 Tax=Tolypothrix sp. VBCCA 56010 TaxID=3137731 RepID=UPI003D7E52CE
MGHGEWEKMRYQLPFSQLPLPNAHCPMPIARLPIFFQTLMATAFYTTAFTGNSTGKIVLEGLGLRAS